VPRLQQSLPQYKEQEKTIKWKPIHKSCSTKLMTGKPELMSAWKKTRFGFFIE
jgi:hypothetical protein